MKKVSKGYLLQDSIFKTFLKWQKHRVGQQINGCQSLGKERDCVTIKTQHEQEFFVGDGTVCGHSNLIYN